jgi:hypothetical protein
LAGQATFAEEISVPVESDDGLFPLLGYDMDSYLALSDVEDGIRRLSLGEDFLVLATAVVVSEATRRHSSALAR